MLAIKGRVVGISLRENKIEMSGPVEETAGVRGVYVVWKATSDRTLGRSIRAKTKQRKGDKRWSHRVVRQARRKVWSSSSARKNAGILAQRCSGDDARA